MSCDKREWSYSTHDNIRFEMDELDYDRIYPDYSKLNKKLKLDLYDQLFSDTCEKIKNGIGEEDSDYIYYCEYYNNEYIQNKIKKDAVMYLVLTICISFIIYHIVF